MWMSHHQFFCTFIRSLYSLLILWILLHHLPPTVVIMPASEQSRQCKWIWLYLVKAPVFIVISFWYNFFFIVAIFFWSPLFISLVPLIYLLLLFSDVWICTVLTTSNSTVLIERASVALRTEAVLATGLFLQISFHFSIVTNFRKLSYF
jgi:hypothetical protein